MIYCFGGEGLDTVFRWIQHWDETILRWITENLRLPLLDKLMVAYTRLGNAGWIFIAASVAMLCIRRTRRASVSSLSAMTLGLLLTNLILKPAVARPRPWIVMEGFVPLTTSGDMNSFPSGHTCAAFSFGMALCVALPQRWAKAAALTAAALMGFSRLYVGVHFPTDVLGGTVVGVFCGYAGAWIVDRVTRWYRGRKAAE